MTIKLNNVFLPPRKLGNVMLHHFTKNRTVNIRIRDVTKSDAGISGIFHLVCRTGSHNQNKQFNIADLKF